MAGPLNAKVIMARCSKTRQSFGIRIEERGGDWVRTWAFPIDERKARNEGFDGNTVTGSLQPVDDYPGCPYCGNAGGSQCMCGQNSCSGGALDCGDHYEMTCPWCGETGSYGTVSSVSVSGGGY